MNWLEKWVLNRYLKKQQQQKEKLLKKQKETKLYLLTELVKFVQSVDAKLNRKQRKLFRKLLAKNDSYIYTLLKQTIKSLSEEVKNN